MEAIDKRSTIKYLLKKGLSPKEIHNEIKSTLGVDSQSKATIYNLVNHFRFGRVTVRDMPRPGKPKYATDEFSVKAVSAMVMRERRFTVQFIGETLKMCPTSVYSIITQDLMMKKVAARWVPKLLSDEQKQERVRLARQSLRLYEANEDEYLARFVTMDETWVHLLTLRQKGSLWNGRTRVIQPRNGRNVQFQRERSWHQFSGTQKA